MRKFPPEAFVQLTVGLLQDRCRLKLRLHGGCMFPCLMDGDDIIVDSIAPDDKLKMGDVLLFRAEHHSMLQAHRLIWQHVKQKGQKYVICRSDRGKEYDIMPRDLVIGRISAVQRGSQDIPTNRWAGRGKALDALLRLSYVLTRRMVMR